MELLTEFLILFGVVSFNIYTLYFLTGSYYDTSNLQAFIIQASQYKPEATNGMKILCIPSVAIGLQTAFFMSYIRQKLAKRI